MCLQLSTVIHMHTYIATYDQDYPGTEFLHMDTYTYAPYSYVCRKFQGASLSQFRITLQKFPHCCIKMHLSTPRSSI